MNTLQYIGAEFSPVKCYCSVNSRFNAKQWYAGGGDLTELDSNDLHIS